MTRKQKLLLNTGMGLLKQIIVTVCGFILPRYMLLYYGSSVNGLVSSMVHFLSFISLLEMGIGPVIQANLYKPLAEKNNEQISKIIISSERFFRKIAYIFLAYMVVLVFVFPTFINSEYDFLFTVSLLLIIAVSTFAQYFFGATYQLLLNADQKSYIQILLQIVTVILNTVFSVALMKMGASIQEVKLLTAAIYVLRPVLQAVYVRKNYNLNKKLELHEEPIKQKWNGFAQHLSAVVCENIDVVVLTLFSSLSNVSIYSIYYSVTSGVTTTIMTAATGLESYFGNMIAKNEKETLVKTFEMVEWIIHSAVTIVFTIAAIMIVPFVSVYTLGIDDANYIVPVFGMLLVAAYAVQCLRIPYFRIIKAAGHFKETQMGSFISMAINVVISVALVFKYGLVGIALGTLTAMFYHTCYFVHYLKTHILNRSAWHFMKYMCTDILICGIAFMLTSHMEMGETTYLAWVIMAVKVTVITVGVSLLVNVVLHSKTLIAGIKKKTMR